MTEKNIWNNIQDKKIFDSEVFTILSSAIGDEKSKQLVDFYIKSCEEQKISLIRALTKKDIEHTEFISHKLISSSGTYGNMKLHHLCIFIEDVCMKGEALEAVFGKENIEKTNTLIEQSINEIKEFTT